jgi:hypothetical protein
MKQPWNAHSAAYSTPEWQILYLAAATPMEKTKGIRRKAPEEWANSLRLVEPKGKKPLGVDDAVTYLQGFLRPP